MENSNQSENPQNAAPNSNQETKQINKLNAAASESETGFKRVPLDVNDPDNQKKLVDLNWYLGIANPVYVKTTVKLNKLQNGKMVAYDAKKTSFDHFEYPNVAGQTFNEWLKANFGDNVKVDPKTKEVYTLVADNNTPAPQPNVNSETEETQPQTNPEVNPNINDPENN